MLIEPQQSMMAVFYFSRPEYPYERDCQSIPCSFRFIIMASFNRPDLPESMQVGVNIYSDSTPDLQVRYENIKIEKLASPAGCEAD
jgi:hypothetical protein